MFERWPYIVAELSGNHNGSLDRAIRIIVRAKAAGCDAVKIQTYEPEEMPDYAEHKDIYEKSRTPREWYRGLFGVAERVGIPLFSSVFSVDGVRFLEKFGCPAYKLASPESTDVKDYAKLVLAITETRKPLIASTGKRHQREIRRHCPTYLLYCVAGYPANVTDDDLEFFSGNPFSGFSDHSAGLKTPLAFIAAGAKIIEKHFKLDDDCVDATFSFNPNQMATLCRLAHR